VIQRLKSEKNVICIKGNHERWALERRRRRKDVRSFFEPVISPTMSVAASTFRARPLPLAALPGHWEGELEGVRVAMWHARPGSDVEGVVKEYHRPELRNGCWSSPTPESLESSATRTWSSTLMVDVPPGKILNPGSLLRESLHL